MKVSVKIPPRKFACKDGSIKAEGKAATPAFCYRVAVQGEGNSRRSKVEFHSRITGKRIGFISRKANVITPNGAEAYVWKEGSDPFQSPEAVEKKVHHFLMLAQDPKADPKATERYRTLSAAAWKMLMREARK